MKCVYTHTPSLLSLPPTSYPIPPLWVVTEHQVELRARYSKFPLAIYFTYGNVYGSTLPSQFVPPSPAVSTSLLSMSVPLFSSVQFSCSVVSDSLRSHEYL